MAKKTFGLSGFAQEFGTLCGVIFLAAAFALVMAGCGGGSGTMKNAKGAAPAEDFSYDLSADGNGIKITGYTGNGGKVIIPAVIEDLPVVEIGERAFLGGRRINTNTGKYFRETADQPSGLIKSLVVPASVVKIGSMAFLSMAGLESVQILGGVKGIPNHAFWGCDALTTVKLPDSIEVIGRAAFASCTTLTSVNLPANLTEIEAVAFAGCGELKDLTIPSSISEVKFSSFQGMALTFQGCGKLPIKTRQAIQGLGYKGNF
jgi:hypothetical protein